MVSETQRLHMAWPVGLQDEVRSLDQTDEELTPGARFDVQGDASLVIVIGEPVEAFLCLRLIVIKGAAAAAGVPSKRLHLDDVGPQVSQDLPAGKTQLPGQVEGPKGRQEAGLLAWTRISGEAHS